VEAEGGKIRHANGTRARGARAAAIKSPGRQAVIAQKHNLARHLKP